MDVNNLDSIIKSSKSILLVSHINPDGDTLGSMCALYNIIKDNYKKTPSMLLVSKLPEIYAFLPDIEKSINIGEINTSRVYDLVINIDVASIDRCADAQILFEKAKNTVVIDHHETNSGYGDINFINPNASATSEVLCEISEKLNWKISKKTAECLYVGIMTDTGSFKFSNTTPQTMRCCAKLLEIGIDNSDLYRKCYESQSKNMVLFQSWCVNKAQFEDNDKIAYTIVYKKDLEKFNCNGEDFTDGLTEKLRAISSTEVAFVVKELSSNISKISVRSKSKDVAKICAKLGGGGHKLAAGAVVKANVKDTVRLVLEELRK